MTFSPEQTKALQAPLDAKRVATRSQSGRELSYIEGWWAISEANRIFGFDGWNRETIDLRPVADPREVDGKWRVAYLAKVRITVRERDGVIVREGCGYGSGIDRDLGTAHESALKEAETDAMKRGLMTFGNPFGLALYDKTQANVSTVPAPPPRNGNGPAPEGHDFWGCDGPGMTAHAAKVAKMDVRHEDMRAEIGRLSSGAEWRAWCKANAEEIAKMPKAWRVVLRQEAEEQARELGIDLNQRRAA